MKNKRRTFTDTQRLTWVLKHCDLYGGQGCISKIWYRREIDSAMRYNAQTRKRGDK